MSKHDVLPYLRALEGFNARWLEDEAFVAEVEDLLEGEHPALEEAAWAEAAIEDKLAAARSVLAPYRTQTGAPIRHVFGELAAGKTYREIERIVREVLDDIAADRHRTVVVLAPTLDNARQSATNLAMEAGLEGHLLLSPGWQAKGADGARICKFGDVVDAVMRRGRSPRGLCQSKTKDGEIVRCERYATCPIRRAHVNIADKPRIVVGAHDYLRLGFPEEMIDEVDELVIDESFLKALLTNIQPVPLDVLKRAVGRLAPLPGEEARDPASAGAARSVAALRGALPKIKPVEEPEAAKEPEEGDEAARKERERLVRLQRTSRALTAALTASGGGSGRVRLVDLPDLTDLMELREMVAERQRRAAHIPFGISPDADVGEARAKAKGLEAFPYAKALEALDLILSAASRGQAILPGVRVVEHPTGFAVTGVMRHAIHPSLAGADRITVLSSTLEPETLSPWFTTVEQEGEWQHPENNLVGRAQVLAGTALTSVIGDGDVLTDLGRGIADQIDAARLTGGSSLLAVSTKRLVKAFTVDLRAREADDRPRGELVVQTYANLLGSNAHRHHDFYFAVGRTLPGYRDLQLTLEALTGGPVEPPPGREPGLIGYWQHEEVDAMTTSGEKYMQRRPAHPNPVAAAFVRETALGPVVQSDRSRAKWRDTPALRVVFGDMASPEKFDRVEHTVSRALGDDLAAVARRWALVPEAVHRGVWQMVALLNGEHDPLGAGVSRVKERSRFHGDAEARIAEERARLGKAGQGGKRTRVGLAIAVIERLGQRAVKVPVELLVGEVAGMRPTEPETAAQGAKIAAEIEAAGLLPEGVTLSFVPRRPRRVKLQPRKETADG